MDGPGGKGGCRISLSQVWMDGSLILLEDVLMYCSPSIFSHYFRLLIFSNPWLAWHNLYGLLGRNLLYSLIRLSSWSRMWILGNNTHISPAPMGMEHYACRELLRHGDRWDLILTGLGVAGICAIVLVIYLVGRQR